MLSLLILFARHCWREAIIVCPNIIGMEGKYNNRVKLSRKDKVQV